MAINILILHGWGSCAKNWGRVKELLENQGYKVYLPDLPGFGEAPPPEKPWSIDNYVEWVRKYIDNLQSRGEFIEPFFLLGHSFGGAVALKFSLKFPEKIKKLFLIGAACFRRIAFRKRLFFLIAKILKIFSFFPFYSQIRKAFYKFIVGRSDYPYTEGVMKDCYLKIIGEDLGSVLEQIQVSTIIIWGEKDKIKKLKEARIINEKIKNSQLEIIPNIGHSPHLEAPEKLVRIIFKYLKEKLS